MAFVTIQIVVISEQDNRPPEVASTFPTEIRKKVGEEFDVAAYCSDPDGDSLKYMFISGGIEMAVSPGETMSIAPNGLITMLKAGSETATVKVDDGKS